MPVRALMIPAVAVFLVLVACGGAAVERGLERPFIDEYRFKPVNKIDRLMLEGLHRHKCRPASLCSDSVFIRRAYLDVIGTLPEPHVVSTFLNDRHPAKRRQLIDQLMEREEFADYWTLKWCDILRVKAEFPINLWPNGVQAYARWIHDAIRDNMAYDDFTRELLTSSGSNFRVPQVNFYRAIQGDKPETIASAVALTFMGSRLEKWPEDRRAGMIQLFSRVSFKNTAEWKEVIVYPSPVATNTVRTILPDGRAVVIRPYEDGRRIFADWLVSGRNPWFNRSICNRVWSWFFGRGIIHEVDDIRRGNPPLYPRLLSYLEGELVSSDYDLRELFRLILNSHIYQQSSIPESDHPDVTKLFAHYPVRRLDAEVLVDALCWISGSHESYQSAIPEPFTFIPRHKRTIELVDGSITSQFLKQFGRPSRDTGLESERSTAPSGRQRLHMLNSTHVRRKIEDSWRFRQLTRESKGDQREVIRRMYMTLLSRPATKKEIGIATDYLRESGRGRNGAVDLFWALINTKEFLYRH